MHVPTPARALASALLLATLGTAPLAAQADAPTASRSDRDGKPALMAWNRKRAFLIVDKHGSRMGELTDFVIDRTTGRLSHTALALERDGKPVATKAMPLREVRWDAAAQRFRSLLSYEGVASLPDFTPAWLKRLELGTHRIVEAGHRKGDDDGPEAPRFLLAGDVEGATVRAVDGVVGEGLGVILDMNPGEAAYFLMGPKEDRSSTLNPVPWTALTPTADGGYGIAKTAAEMARAPEIAKELIASLTMPAFRKEIAAFYGVPSRIDERLERALNRSGS